MKSLSIRIVLNALIVLVAIWLVAVDRYMIWASGARVDSVIGFVLFLQFISVVAAVAFVNIPWFNDLVLSIPSRRLRQSAIGTIPSFLLLSPLLLWLVLDDAREKAPASERSSGETWSKALDCPIRPVGGCRARIEQPRK